MPVVVFYLRSVGERCSWVGIASSICRGWLVKQGRSASPRRNYRRGRCCRRTDALFPPKIAPNVIKALTAAGVEARYFELDSDLGHSSSGPEHAKWSPVLREFLAPLVARLN